MSSQEILARVMGVAHRSLELDDIEVTLCNTLNIQPHASTPEAVELSRPKNFLFVGPKPLIWTPF